jgi:hypothetical protein
LIVFIINLEDFKLLLQCLNNQYIKNKNNYSSINKNSKRILKDIKLFIIKWLNKYIFLKLKNFG